VRRVAWRTGVRTGALTTAVVVGACMAGRRAASGPPPANGPVAVQEGLASYYGAEFQGRRTASGIPFDRRALVAAHPTLPFGSRVRVRNLATGASVVLRIVDRGPAAGPRAAGVIIDVSEAAAERLNFVSAGRARVRVEVLSQPR
jgi:rare lipoprotein A